MSHDRLHYWRGQQLLQLKKSDVHPDCDWAHGSHSATKLAIVNMAFKRLFWARIHIDRAGTNSKLKERLKDNLETAGTEGDNGWGITSMKEACVHVMENWIEKEEGDGKYLWTDEKTRMVHLPKLHFKDGTQTDGVVNQHVPYGIATFLTELKDQLNDHRDECIKTVFPRSDAIIKGFDKSNYDGVIKALEGFKADIDNLDKISWLLDSSKKDLITAAKGKVSYIGFLSQFNTALDDMHKYRSQGFSDKTSLAFVALKKAVGLVPGLGDFYGQIVGSIPEMAAAYKKDWGTRQKKILALARAT